MPVSMLSTSLFSDRKSYSRFNALDTIYTPPRIGGPGMVLVSPTSITHSGTSATLGANGQVTFSAVTSLSLNGCFTADFDTYVVSTRYSGSFTDVPVFGRLRASGSDASGTDYVQQRLFGQNTTVAANRTTRSDFWFGSTSSTDKSGDTTYFYNPFAAEPTATRNISVIGQDNCRLIDVASTHSLSTSYDGFTLLPNSSYNITGDLAVYGIRS